ncbi:MAG: glycosyltransferase [Patescibacteria group bacterium]
MGKIRLSIVIPAYNEEENIKNGCLNSVWQYLKKVDYSWEVILVDDESTDSTLELLNAFSKLHPGFKISPQPHRGKGGTVIAGMSEAKGEIVLFTDLDQATPLPEIEKFFPEFEKGNDIVIGIRSGRKGAPLIRKIMAFGFSMLRTIILNLNYKDTQCGFKAFKQGVAKEIFKKMKVYDDKTITAGAAVTAGFDLEVLYIARKQGYKVAQVPVIWNHKDTERINPIKDSLDGLMDLIKVRINTLRGMYK